MTLLPIVARPFPKFFNYGTPQVGELPVDEPYRITEKVDGSLGILYYLDDLPCIATRGSFDSDQAKVGTEIIRDREVRVPPNTTALFEIVYPENRIVVDYGDRRDLVLLGGVRNDTATDILGVGYSGPSVEVYPHTTPIEALAALEQPNQEGFVVSFASGLRVKVKFAEYVRLHKIVTGVNARMIWESLRDGADLSSLIDGVPDEIYTWIENTRAKLLAAYEEVEDNAGEVFALRPQDADRKTLAGYFVESKENAAVLFRMLDGKPYDDLIWKAVKPGPLVPPSALATASINLEERP